MKIVEINMTTRGSTGKIMIQIAEQARLNGHNVLTCSPHLYKKKFKKLYPAPSGHRYFGNYLSAFFHLAMGKVFANNGGYSYFATKKLIREIKKYQPDILHLHNLHAFCINLPLLFKYIKKDNVRSIWTLHDCWAFTGHCPYFDMVGCEKWRTSCNACLNYKSYPKEYWDNSKRKFKKKRKMFTGIKDMTLVTPSKWLARLVEQSFLKNYPTKVINNGIDLNVFKPTQSDFRERYNCKNKFIILGVADSWGQRKGLDVFIELSKRLDREYQIVLVGTTDSTDKILPENIISIHRTENQIELAKIYSVADLFVNPTREENYPTVNMESIACGTPVLTFRTGGSPEILDLTCGAVVEKNDVDALEMEIIRIDKERPFTTEACLNRAKSFDMKDKFRQYINLYERK